MNDIEMRTENGPPVNIDEPFYVDIEFTLTAIPAKNQKDEDDDGLAYLDLDMLDGTKDLEENVICACDEPRICRGFSCGVVKKLVYINQEDEDIDNMDIDGTSNRKETGWSAFITLEQILQFFQKIQISFENKICRLSINVRIPRMTKLNLEETMEYIISKPKTTKGYYMKDFNPRFLDRYIKAAIIHEFIPQFNYNLNGANLRNKVDFGNRRRENRRRISKKIKMVKSSQSHRREFIFKQRLRLRDKLPRKYYRFRNLHRNKPYGILSKFCRQLPIYRFVNRSNKYTPSSRNSPYSSHSGCSHSDTQHDDQVSDHSALSNVYYLDNNEVLSTASSDNDKEDSRPSKRIRGNNNNNSDIHNVEKVDYYPEVFHTRFLDNNSEGLSHTHSLNNSSEDSQPSRRSRYSRYNRGRHRVDKDGDDPKLSHNRFLDNNDKVPRSSRSSYYNINNRYSFKARYYDDKDDNVNFLDNNRKYISKYSKHDGDNRYIVPTKQTGFGFFDEKTCSDVILHSQDAVMVYRNSVASGESPSHPIVEFSGKYEKSYKIPTKVHSCIVSDILLRCANRSTVTEKYLLKVPEEKFLYDSYIGKIAFQHRIETLHTEHLTANSVVEETKKRFKPPIFNASQKLVNQAEERGYSMSPSYEKLVKMSGKERQNVRLIVSRQGFGKVVFEKVNLNTVHLNLIMYYFVRIEEGKVIVYPDISVKPSPGRGLNVSAIVTLERCYATNYETGLPENDPRSMYLRYYVLQLRSHESKRFINYDSRLMEWTYSVEHF